MKYLNMILNLLFKNISYITRYSIVLFIFLFHAVTAHAYYFEYDVSISYGYTSLVTEPGSFSVTDNISASDESTWEIVSAEDDGSGGVNITYDYSVGPWDYDNALIMMEFRILSDHGGLTPEPVNVDIWGDVRLNYEFQSSFPVLYACCIPDLFVDNSVEFFNGTVVSNYDPETGYYTYNQDGAFSDTYTLMTNTDYYFMYNADIYAESTGDNPLHPPPPNHFASWEDYEAFIAEYGTSGTAYANADGIFHYDMEISSIERVPEPNGLLLLLAGVMGVVWAKKNARC